MKKYFNKIFSLIFVFMITIVLSGCAKIEYYRVVDAYGYIMEKLVIEIDKEAIDAAFPENTRARSYSANDLVGIIMQDFKDFENKVAQWELDNFGMYDILYAELRDGITIDKIAALYEDGIKASLTIGFESEKLLYIFYGVAEITNENGDVVEYTPMLNDYGPFLTTFDEVEVENDGFFTYKYDVRNSKTIADALNTEDSDNDGKADGDEYYLGYIDKYGALFSGLYDMNDVLLYQVFGFPDEKLHSNADYESVEGGINLFKWKIDISQDETLEIYKTGANRYLWYITAIVVSIVSVIVIAVNIKKNKEPVKKVTNESDIVDED